MTPRFLVVQTAFIGDVVLTTALIARLARRGTVDVVTTPAGATLLLNHPGVRHIIAFDKQRGSVGAMMRVRRAIRAGGPLTAAYLAQGSARSGLIAWAAGAPERVGFSSSAGSWTYTTRVTPDAPPGVTMHHAERLWRLDAGVDIAATADDIRPRLYPSENDHEAAVALLNAAGWRGEPLIALAPGSVWGTKRWPYYRELASRVAALGRVVVLGGAEDRQLAMEIQGGTDHVIDATGRLPLLATAALLSRCRAIITNDSAPLHLASAMNVPTLAIFGPTTPEIGYGPLASVAKVVETARGEGGLTCRPCHSHGPRVCPLGHHRCMRDLDAGLVVGVLEGLIRASEG